MRKTIIANVSLVLAFLTILSVFLMPIYTFDQKFVFDHFDHQVEKIMNEDLTSDLFDHTFTKKSFDSITIDYQNKNIAMLSDRAWEVSYHSKEHNYQEVDGGLQIDNGVTLTCLDVDGFTNIVIYASGEGTTLKIKANHELVSEVSLTNEIARYYYKVEAKNADIEISFSNTVVVSRIKINEKDPYTHEEAQAAFIDRIFTYTVLIMSNLDLLNMTTDSEYAEYLTEEFLNLRSGIPFLSLFNMIIEDATNNIAIFQSSAGMPFSQRLDYYKEYRHCSFFSILTCLSALGIAGSLICIGVLYIIKTINKKEYKFIIPALVLVGSLAILLNMSTFTNLNFFTFNGDHNFVTEYRLLFYESVKLNVSFVIAIVLSVVLLIVNLVNVILDYVNSKKNKKSLIVYSAITMLFVLLILVGLIIK